MEKRERTPKENKCTLKKPPRTQSNVKGGTVFNFFKIDEHSLGKTFDKKIKNTTHKVNGFSITACIKWKNMNKQKSVMRILMTEKLR